MVGEIVGKRGSEGEGRERREERGDGDTEEEIRGQRSTGVRRDQMGKKGRVEEREGEGDRER